MDASTRHHSEPPSSHPEPLRATQSHPAAECGLSAELGEARAYPAFDPVASYFPLMLAHAVSKDD